MDMANWDFGNEKKQSDAVKDELTQTLSKGNPAVKKQFLRELEAQDVLAGYAALFPQYPLRERNLAQCMALYWLSMARAVQGGDFPSSTTFDAVTLQCAKRLHGDHNAMDPARRQMMGEVMMYETIFAVEAVKRAIATGSSDALKTLSTMTHQNCLKRGLDFQKLVLTESGFVGEGA
jgi:hypothetical protein